MQLVQGQPPARWVSRLVVGLVILSLSAAWLGDLFLAAVIDREPLLLIALTPRNRNLAVVANAITEGTVTATQYYVVGFLRLIASDPLYFLIGFWYGDRALAWTKRRSRTYGPYIDEAGGWFKKFAYPLIFIAPNNIICLLAGAFGIKIRTFLILNLSGTVVRLFLVRQFASLFSDQISGVVGFVGNNRLPIFILSGALVAWTIFGEFRGNDSEIKGLIDLEEHAEPGVSGSASSGEGEPSPRESGESSPG